MEKMYVGDSKTSTILFFTLRITCTWVHFIFIRIQNIMFSSGWGWFSGFFDLHSQWMVLIFGVPELAGDKVACRQTFRLPAHWHMPWRTMHSMVHQQYCRTFLATRFTCVPGSRLYAWRVFESTFQWHKSFWSIGDAFQRRFDNLVLAGFFPGR